MEEKLNSCTEEFGNFMKNVKNVKKELDKLENEGYKFFRKLEKELEAFMNFYDNRWDKVKKKIRKRLLNYQSLKERTGKIDQP